VRIVSLLPSATEIVFALGLGDDLVGVTDRCGFPVEARDLPVVARGGVVDREALLATDADLVLAPEQPGRRRGGGSQRAIGRAADGPPGRARGTAAGARSESDNARSDADLVGLMRELGGDRTLLRLGPTSVEGVLNAIQAVGAMTETEDAALFLVEGLRERLRAVQEIVVGRRDHDFKPPRVAAIGNLSTPSTTGYWVPEQVRLAGGWELLGSEGAPATDTTWDAVIEVDPEVVVLMPPDLDLPGTTAAWAELTRPDGWPAVRAVREDRVFAVDGAAYFAHPGPRVVDGIEVLSELIDPIAFDGMSPPDSWERVA
jgi:iron complex transport system substrate-binding protein